jgi:hypothetical protein
MPRTIAIESPIAELRRAVENPPLAFAMTTPRSAAAARSTW